MGKVCSRRGWLRGLLAALVGLVGLRQVRGAEPADKRPAPFPGEIAPGAGGWVRTYQYDANGRVVCVSDADLPGLGTSTTCYDVAGRVTSVTDPGGSRRPPVSTSTGPEPDA
jgi:hypothetical protein